MSEKYFIGQRVIYNDEEICRVIRQPLGRTSAPTSIWYVWIVTYSGVEMQVSLSNVKPLPGGQL